MQLLNLAATSATLCVALVACANQSTPAPSVCPPDSSAQIEAPATPAKAPSSWMEKTDAPGEVDVDTWFEEARTAWLSAARDEPSRWEREHESLNRKLGGRPPATARLRPHMAMPYRTFYTTRQTSVCPTIQGTIDQKCGAYSVEFLDAGQRFSKGVEFVVFGEQTEQGLWRTLLHGKFGTAPGFIRADHVAEELDTTHTDEFEAALPKGTPQVDMNMDGEAFERWLDSSDKGPIYLRELQTDYHFPLCTEGAKQGFDCLVTYGGRKVWANFTPLEEADGIFAWPLFERIVIDGNTWSYEFGDEVHLVLAKKKGALQILTVIDRYGVWPARP